jgi:hypothetical protein
MTRRAFLIGSETSGLTGCDADVALVRDLLGARGFDEIATVTGADASRQGLVDGFEALIASTAHGDAVVVYYSGHGGRMEHPEWAARQAAGLPGHIQFIVPWDIEASTDDDFRGLLSEELSDFQWRLTERTQNVTTILDCCHSGYMARNFELVPKAIAREFPIDGLVARLDAVPEARRDGGGDTNPNAVRIVACQPEQSAYERRSRLGPGRHGVLTESLAVVLDELGERRLTWTVIGELVGRRVVEVVPQQQPEVEGPSDRLPFSEDVRKRPQAYPVRVDGAAAVIEAAPLLGIAPEDTFRLVSPDDDRKLGAAEVDRLDGDRAVLEVTLEPGTPSLPTPCEAVPIATSLPPRPVRVDASGGDARALEQEIGKSHRLRIAEGDEPVLATVRADGGLVVEDGAGLRMRTDPLPDDEAGRQAAVALVELLAAAERIRGLASGQGEAALADPVEIKLTRHAAGTPTRCRLTGERLFEGDEISVTIRNRGDRTVFVWLFDVGIAGRTSLVTRDAPAGFALAPKGSAGEARTVGGAKGRALEWHDEVPRDAGRSEVFLIVLADRQQNLRPLETPEATARRSAGMPASALDSLLEEVRSGTRDWGPEEGAPSVQYRVERIEFFLEPHPRPRLDEPKFAINDLPDASMRGLLPRAAEPPPERVAVRLVEMMVRKNRALFRAAVRVDALVVTRGPDGGPGIAYPTTFRFPNIGDRTQLPLENVRLYDGDVRDFLDLALWVNRDDTKGKDLAELFAGELARPEVKSALTALGGLVLAAPQVAVAFGAVAAVATLVSVGAKLVEAVTGNEIGTYRTSKLAFERFGVGRTPTVGRRQAQDVEFAYEVVELE